MGTRCGKCNYIAPDGPHGRGRFCPKCGEAYQDHSETAPDAAPTGVHDAPPKMPSYKVSAQAVTDRARAPAIGTIILWVIAVLSLVFGLGTMVAEASAIHQILAAIYFLTFTVAISALYIAGTLGNTG